MSTERQFVAYLETFATTSGVSGSFSLPRVEKALLRLPPVTAMLALPLKGKRDYVVLALLVGCALRRRELAALEVETIQQREGRWVLADLVGKGRRVRTVAVPLWVKQAINVWQTAARIEEGRLLRSIRKGGKRVGEELSDWAVVSVWCWPGSLLRQCDGGRE